ncbi:hypothetical protein [Rubripirellula reticaptiva]|uniref:Uncharacterized protein n=1 Tax=Rubripirellula reticaptiva TaxID=2528013 RepID=A0A5C6EMV0_9BACT|nr:hypothetical protein [Rubripirellula reticaptiva]TWU49730.1 hypothetical protein Poly59_43540 [Rubripirellula reticaptiva]
MLIRSMFVIAEASRRMKPNRAALHRSVIATSLLFLKTGELK